jgi:two-component system chemotaxis sensor kinase CheA
VTGGEIRADIALLERLREPLLHLIRNAIAHGIELPAERLRKGKPEKGRITLEAERDRESLIIRIRDDGSGIDRGAIRRYLNQKFGMSDVEILDMSKKKFYETILSSDFSGSRGVDQMSGRGIGMSVVARAIEYLSGVLSVESVPDAGVTFTVQLPVSLSVIYAVVFQVGPYLFSIPTSALESVGVLDSDGVCLTESCLHLRELFRISGSPEEPSHVLKIHPITRHSGDGAQLTGLVESLVVDRVIGNKPIMIMHVVELVARTRLFSGIGILENGMISLLLDIPALFSTLSKA